MVSNQSAPNSLSWLIELSHEIKWFYSEWFQTSLTNVSVLTLQIRDDNKKMHPCLTFFNNMSEEEKNFDITMAYETLRYGPRSIGNVYLYNPCVISLSLLMC